MNYWTQLFTWDSWQEFLRAGGKFAGFPERRRISVQKIQSGDIILCYLIGVSRYIGLLKVTGQPFKGYSPIFSERIYPCRVPVKILLSLMPEYGIPVTDLRHELSYFQNLSTPRAWTAHFRSSPIQETDTDAEAVIFALENVADEPIFREVDKNKLPQPIPVYETPEGKVTVPDNELEESDSDDTQSDNQTTTHEEIQWLLLTTGSKMGLDVWVATNDKGRSYKGQKFQDIPHLKKSLPRQFDEATNRTIELIDVLWLKEGAILAAFEVEHTSTIYSGLLRMADPISMQPNLHIRLYIVAPNARRDKVFTEINRPVFSRLSPPLTTICRYIPYSALKEKLAQHRDVLSYLRPEFLDDISEKFEAPS